jgi:uncharacterized integral membrane protein (TIGR00697 family)
MNEALFFMHVAVVMGCVLGTLRLGREALMIWVSIQSILANLFVIKQISFIGFEVTCSDVFAIGSLLGLNLLQEHFGQASAKKATLYCFFTMLFFAAMAQIHLLYQPSIHDTTQGAFAQLLGPNPRLIIASLAVFFLIQQLDIRFFGALKKWAPKLPRNLISLFLSQFLDTVLFSFLGLYGIVSSIFDIIFISFLIKCLVILCSTPFMAFSKRFVKTV